MWRVFRRSHSRWPYLAAVALLAASVSDQLVAAVANTGVFGRTYFDTDNSSIAPALVAAVILAGGVIAGHMFAACRRSSTRRRDWFAVVARDVAAHAPLRDLRLLIGLQFAALFAMESAESLVADGRLADGAGWLGGPPLFAVTLHVAVGIACALTASWLMRVSVEPFASLVCSALDRVRRDRSVSRRAILVVRRDEAAGNHARAACVRRISGRAPPVFLLPA